MPEKTEDDQMNIANGFFKECISSNALVLWVRNTFKKNANRKWNCVL
jgi:hypothetical protein